MERVSVAFANAFSYAGGMYGSKMPYVFATMCAATAGMCLYKKRWPTTEDGVKIGIMTLGYPVVIPGVLYIESRTFFNWRTHHCIIQVDSDKQFGLKHCFFFRIKLLFLIEPLKIKTKTWRRCHRS